MPLFYFSIALAILCTAFYHIVQRLTPSGANPALSLLITYLSAAVLCLVLFPLYPLKDGFAAAFKQLNWTSHRK